MAQFAAASLIALVESAVLLWGKVTAFISVIAPYAVIVAAIIAAAVIAIIVAKIVYEAKVERINKENMDKTVEEILKSKKGSIKNAPLPPGSPSWNDIVKITLVEIMRRAQRGEIGFKEFYKLLTQGTYNK